MNIRHPTWNLSATEAIQLQNKLASQIIIEDKLSPIQKIAGADLALNLDKNEGIAGVILYEYPSLKEIERVYATAPLEMPYIPGLLSFREGPVLLKAFEKLKNSPDLILFDGQGIAHPRGLGIASHIGLILDIPSIGCAKSVLCGQYKEPNFERGSHSPLIYKGKEIGTALRTKEKVKPMFISPGHRISLKTSVRIVLDCNSGYRLPKPTREADRYVANLKKDPVEINELLLPLF